VLADLLRAAPRLAVVVITAHSSIETAVEAMRRGARDYVPKPFTPEQLNQTFTKIAQTRHLLGRVAELEDRVGAEFPTEDVETEDPAMKRVYELVRRAATSSATILLLGPSGTGKSVLARHIHRMSKECESPFVTVNCPCLPRELLESALFGHVRGAFTGAISDTWGKVAAADGGVLFLDEIGELPLELQPKLLRLLQEREYERVGEAKTRHANLRLIAATNRDLAQAVKEGKFREDLFYRLNVITANVPPLRERGGDLDRLALDFLKFFASKAGKPKLAFSAEAWRMIRNYTWPGNLRELKNAIERAVILAGSTEILASDLPDQMQGASGAPVQLGSRVTLAELEAEHIRRVLGFARSQEEAAQLLGIDPTTLYRKRRRMENGGETVDGLKTA
jgi:NtrC-family two-component system response regulator AlgB